MLENHTRGSQFQSLENGNLGTNGVGADVRTPKFVFIRIFAPTLKGRILRQAFDWQSAL